MIEFGSKNLKTSQLHTKCLDLFTEVMLYTVIVSE